MKGTTTDDDDLDGLWFSYLKDQIYNDNKPEKLINGQEDVSTKLKQK